MTARRGLVGATALGALLSASVVGPPPPAARAQEDPGSGTFSKALGDPDAHLVAAGPDGSVFVAGTAWTPGIPRPVPDPGTPGDAYFVARFGADGETLSTTILGSFWHPQRRDLRAMRIAPDGSVWIAGHGVLAGGARAIPDPDRTRFDGEVWVARIRSDGEVAFTVPLGGTGDDQPTGLALTSDGDAVVAGISWSDDLPLLDPFQPEHGGGASDGFVARIRGDGSGVAWISRLGGPASDGVADVAAAPSGDVLAVVHGFGHGSVAPYPAFKAEDPVDLVRISADGSYATARSLPHGIAAGFSSTPFRLAIGADGAVFAGATNQFPLGTEGTAARAFVLRLAPDGSAPSIRWSASSVLLNQLAVTPSGDPVVATYGGTNPRVDIPESDDAVTFVRGEPPVATRVFACEDETWTLLDVDVAPDGALCVVGRGLGVPFRAPDSAMAWDGSFVARLPRDVPAAPSRLRGGRASTRSVELRWSRDGEPAARYVLERFVGSYTYDQRWRTVATVRGDRRRGRVGGLLPGSAHRFRIVAEFPSGVRIAGPDVAVSTRPEAPNRVTVSVRYGDVRVRWRHFNDRQTGYVVQRSVGGGPFVALPYEASGWHSPRNGLHRDALPLIPGVPIVYRVRAVLATPRGVWVSPWTESDPFVPPPIRLRPRRRVDSSDDV